MTPFRCQSCQALWTERPAACSCGSTDFVQSGLRRGDDAAWNLIAEQLRGEVLCAVTVPESPAAWNLWWTGPTRAVLKLGAVGDWAVYTMREADLPADEEAALAQVIERGIKLHRDEACGLFPFANPETYRR